MDYIPDYPVETQVITTHTDGLWGTHEYSRLPQRLAPGRWHVACIPNIPSPPELPHVLWMGLRPEQDWQEDLGIGFKGLGYIVDETRRPLAEAAETAIRRFEAMSCTGSVRKYGAMLVMILRQVVDRLRYLPASAGVSIAVAAHVQRVCLELAGLKTYVEVVAPRLSTSDDFSLDVLQVVGAFVAEASDAQNATRVGLPTWFLQPLTEDLPVWAVVDTRAPPLYLSARPMHPPILQHPDTLVGVGNITGNWQESMLLRVSKHVAGTHLASLSLAEVPVVAAPHPLAKRPRVHDEDICGTHYRMAPATPVPVVARNEKAPRRTRHRGSGGRGGQPGNVLNPPGNSTPAAEQSHPSKALVRSPFYDLAAPWEAALLAVGVVPRSASSATYFYPPPFLLDTVSSLARLPPDCPYPERARPDEKAHRYLHNLVRIRRFLRARLFDPTLSHEPLTIAEWRAALWGDYEMKTHPPRPSGSPSDLRRAQRRQGQRNAVTKLLSRVAMLRSYRPDESVACAEARLTAEQIATDAVLRRRLIWESHEINFRAEVMALDTLLVHQSTWLEIHRWERESLVSGIWGPPSSAISVLPVEEQPTYGFRWGRPTPGLSEGEMASHTLMCFVQVLARWPDCPQHVVQAAAADGSTTDWVSVQGLAIDFYVRTFVNHYARLPVPPIALSDTV